VEYRTLGRGGIVVSSVALGAMTFGNETDEAGSFAQLDAFLEAGGNLVDTADVYNDGASEEIIGRWLADRPTEISDRVVIATKGRFPTGTDINEIGLSRRHLDRALGASLKRLGVEAIDLYQVHAWDPLTPVEETLSFLDAAVRAGKIRYFGLSNFTGWQLQLAVSTAAAHGWERPVSLQSQYNLLTRELEWEIMPAALANGLGLLPWSPLAGGLLSGKYARAGAPGSDTRAASQSPVYQTYFRARDAEERTWGVVDTVRQIGSEIGVTPAQVALAWTADRPGVSSVIIGARTTQQLADNLGAVDLKLGDEHVAALLKVSDPNPAAYPYGHFGTWQRERTVHGAPEL
jgi:aryl-alcohol dehydrogenase-like predicted oxidoreductase